MKAWAPLGFDKMGRPIVVTAARRWDPQACSDTKLWSQYMMLMLDQVCASGSTTTDQFTLAFDLEGLGYSNVSRDLLKTILRIAQNVYLGTMHKIAFFNTSFTSRALYGMARPFLSQRV